ncbi:MAG: CotH kinase family protein [Paludibacter sp.]
MNQNLPTKRNRIVLFLFILGSSANLISQTQITNLPTFYITTTNSQPINDKVTWIPGNILIKSSDSSEELNMLTEIRGRGNSTWNFSKKPYRIKLDKKTNLLNLPAKEKSWVLLANHADKTLLRNTLTFKISEILGFEFSPSARFVDLVLNNNFLGNYLVSDQLEVSPFRVNIDEQTGNDTIEPAISGGYLLELDGFASSETVWFTSGKGMKISVKSPDDDVIKSQQLNYIKNYINDFETRLFSSDFKNPQTGYRSRVDTTSLINWYIASELTGNSDSFWSTYVYKKRSDDKLYFGPLWDYDIAFNNDNRLGDATLKLMRENAHAPRTWIERIWQDEWFQTAVRNHWKQITSNNLIGKLISHINETSALINQSQQQNFTKWNVLNTRVYDETYLFSTYSGGVDYLKTYLGNRVNFLTTSFNNTGAKPSEAFIAGNQYYMIMNKKTNNVIDVTDESVEPNAGLILWEPESDEGQLWQINSLGNDLYRIINKRSMLAMAGNGKGNSLIQVAINDYDNAQKWKIIPVSTGNIYGIINYKSLNSINNYQGSFENGSKTVEADNNIATNPDQQWYLQKMDLIYTGLTNTFDLIQSMQLYPNPASDKITIRFSLLQSADVAISIYNIAGEKMYMETRNTLESGDHLLTIPLAEYHSGIYFVSVSTSNGDKSTRKLFINK